MTPTALIKQEEQSIPLNLYAIASSSPSPEPRYNNTQLPSIQRSSSFYPEVPLAKIVRGTPRYGHSSSFGPCEPPPKISDPLVPPSVITPIAVASSPSTSPTSSDSSGVRRVSRPPNAFILFRSDFLKRGFIPSHVECRQQNLSRIVGQVWNMLDPEVKAKWHEQAAIALIEHQRKNPDYKFTPAPRGSRRNKRRGQGKPISDKPNNIRDIREKYVNIIGPSPPSVRKRRQPKTSFDTKKQTEKQTSIPPPFTALHPSFPPPSAKPHYVFRIDQSPPLTPYRSMTSLLESSIPRRPSTLLGSHPPPKRNLLYGSLDLAVSSTRPPSTTSSTPDCVWAHGEELSSAENQFGSISAPYSPLPYDRTLWKSYSTVDTSKSSEPILSSTTNSTEHEADFSSAVPLSIHELVDDASILTTAPTASSKHMENYHLVDGHDPNTLFASFGFADDSIASLTPVFENMQVPLDDPTSQMWFPPDFFNLEDWDLNVRPDNIDGWGSLT